MKMMYVADEYEELEMTFAMMIFMAVSFNYKPGTWMDAHYSDYSVPILVLLMIMAVSFNINEKLKWNS